MRICLVLFVGLVVAAGGEVAGCAGRSVQAEGLIVFTRSVGEKKRLSRLTGGGSCSCAVRRCG